MRVRMLVTMSGTRDGKPWPTRGNTIDVPDEEGADLCRNNLAIPSADVDDDVEVSTPSTVAVETRTAPPAVTEKPLTTKTGPGPGRKGTR